MGRGLKASGLMLAALIAANSHANVISATGAIQVIAPPASGQLGNLISDTTAYGFRERQNVLLPYDVSVDAIYPGLYLTDQSTGLVVRRGTRVDSFMIHGNSFSDGDYSTSFIGSITWDTIILGVIFNRTGLNSTDGLLGFPSTVYPAGDRESSFRELEMAGLQQYCAVDASDCVGIQTDRRTLEFFISQSSMIDQIRILTAAKAPEPGTLALLGFGLAGLGLSRRRTAYATRSLNR